jgi:hypothetical protein
VRVGGINSESEVHARTCFQDRDHINIAFNFAHKGPSYSVYIILAGAIRFVLFLYGGGPILFASPASSLLSDATKANKFRRVWQTKARESGRKSRLALKKVQRSSSTLMKRHHPQT